MAGQKPARVLEAGKHYVLTPSMTEAPAGGMTRVLGPFEGHEKAWAARSAWAYSAEDVADRAEILTGEELARDYAGLHGVLAG
jgi:hypothetical protein